MGSADDLRSLPVMPEGAPRPAVSHVATGTAGATPGEIDHWNSQRTLSVTANVAGHDLAAAARQVDAAVTRAGTPPRGSTVAAHGQVEQMLLTLASLRGGLLLAIVVILLLLAANFQSIRAALVVLSTTPAVLVGVRLALRMTGTSLDVQPMMRALMSIGWPVGNAARLRTCARAPGA